MYPRSHFPPTHCCLLRNLLLSTVLCHITSEYNVMSRIHFPYIISNLLLRYFRVANYNCFSYNATTDLFITYIQLLTKSHLSQHISSLSFYNVFQEPSSPLLMSLLWNRNLWFSNVVLPTMLCFILII